VFDFPTFFDIRDVFAKDASLETLSKTLAKDRLYSDAGSLVTFLGNHDVPRFMHDTNAAADRLKVAFTFLMTVRGTPCIYYGDEIAMPGGNDPDNRRDFPGGWKNDPRNAFEASGRTAQENSIFMHVQKLAALRTKLEPLRRGKLIDLAVGEKTWVFARESNAGTVIVAINNGADSSELTIPYGSDRVFKNQLGVAGDLAVRGGSGRVRLPAHSAEIYARP
jgi:glycosidase